MGKGWLLSKTKHDSEPSTHVLVELAHWLFKENRPVPWRDAGLPSGGWFLNHRRVTMSPVPHEERQQQYEIRRR
jgi:hypothetical protein